MSYNSENIKAVTVIELGKLWAVGYHLRLWSFPPSSPIKIVLPKHVALIMWALIMWIINLIKDNFKHGGH